MKQPTMKFGKYKLIYCQIPYDKRYYRVYYNGHMIVDVPCYLGQAKFVLLVWRIIQDNEVSARFDRFIDRCDQYDQWLDNTD